VKINKIYNENCLDTMSRMEDNFIDLTVTSPPYDNLRNYNGYEFNFENIAKELFRVTKKGGVVVWVVGDATVNGSETGTSFKQALYFKEIGFNLHDTMIYAKDAPAYASGENSLRYSSVTEYMFILSKEIPKTVNLIMDKKNFQFTGKHSNHTARQKDGSLKAEKRFIKKMGVRNNIWEYSCGFMKHSCDKESFEHPATFPEQLAADHIYSWSNKGDLVYDPFTGSGTTLKMAIKQDRNFIGSEISEEYCKIAQKRIDNELLKIKMF